MFEGLTFDPGVIESAWLLVNGATFITTLAALGDARANQHAVHLRNGPARTIYAKGDVRRAWFDVIIQVLLLAVGVYVSFVPGHAQLTPATAILMVVPLVLLAASSWAWLDRYRLAELVKAS